MRQDGAMVEVAFSLGSNLGDKRGHIDQALAALQATGLVSGVEASRRYRTEPWGPVAQDWYVNACAVALTDLPPLDLLHRVKALEVALGRVETIRWGPRAIDIDILYYDDVTLDAPNLTLPHPGLAIRPFVLIPLAELRPDHVVAGRRISALASECGSTGVERLDP